MEFTIRRAEHTGITVTDLEHSITFWQDVLGFELSHRDRVGGAFAAQVTGVPDADISTAVLTAPGGHQVELMQFHQPHEQDQPRPRQSDPGSMHLAFAVDDLDAALAEMARAGWTAAGTPQVTESGARAGNRSAYVHDPDGTTIELIQPRAEQAVDEQARITYRNMATGTATMPESHAAAPS